MLHLTEDQKESLIHKIYLTLINTPTVDENGEPVERGMGEMGETREEAERIVNEWLEENKNSMSAVIEGINFDLLKEQKGRLIQMQTFTSNQNNIDALEGVINLLDALQDANESPKTLIEVYATEGWLYSEKYGMFYTIEGNELIGAPAFKNGTKDSESYPIEWYAIEEYQHEFKAEILRLFGEVALTIDPVKFIK